MEKLNVLNEMWNVNKHMHRTSSVVEGWNCKQNSIMGNEQSDVFLQGQKCKGIAEFVSWELK